MFLYAAIVQSDLSEAVIGFGVGTSNQKAGHNHRDRRLGYRNPVAAYTPLGWLACRVL